MEQFELFLILDLGLIQSASVVSLSYLNLIFASLDIQTESPGVYL